MKAVLKTGLALAGLWLALGLARAAPAETLRWIAQDLPPHFSYEQGRAPRSPAELGHGEIAGFMRQLIARMPEYRHEFVEANTARFEALTRSGETLCSTLHVRTPERLKWLYFSHLYPPLVARDIHVVVARDKLDRFEPTEQLTLLNLLQRTDLHLMLARDRSFGTQIDALLARGTGSQLTRVGASQGKQLLDMLRSGRMDYTLEYAAVADDYLSKSAHPQALVKLPVAEGVSTSLATVACSRTPAGLKRIEAIDAAVRQLARDPQREQWIRAWRGDGIDARDLKRLNQYLDERARNGARIE